MRLLSALYWLRLGLFVPLLLLIAVEAGLLFCDYTAWLDFLMHYYAVPENEFQQEILSRNSFFQLRIGWTTLTFLSLIGYGLVWQKATRLSAKVESFFQEAGEVVKGMKAGWNNLSSPEKRWSGVLAAGMLAVHSYFLVTSPVLIDEAFSYVFFVDKGFAVSAVYYPGPNNHIFYSLLCCFADLFLESARWVMKLPAFAAGLLSVLLLFLFFNRKYGFTGGMLVAVLYGTASSMAFYFYQGRGYSVMVLMLIVMCLALYQMHAGARRGFYTVFYTLAIALGFYTIPVFLYPFVTVQVWALTGLNHKSYAFWKYWLTGTLAGGLMTGILYLPVFFFNGLGAVSNNSWVEPMAYSDLFEALPAYLNEMAGHFWQVSSYGSVLFILFLIALIIAAVRAENSRKKWFALAIAGLVLPLLFVLVHKVLPFQRVWTYLQLWKATGLAFILLTGLHVVGNRRWQVLLAGLLCIGLTGYYGVYQYNLFGRNFGIYQHVRSLSAKIYKSKADKVYAGKDLYNVFIRYEFARHNQGVEVTVEEPEQGGYDWLILPKHADFPDAINKPAYKKVYEDPFVDGYRPG